MLEEITIIIPTHERDNYLYRAVSYYTQFNVKIIIADSSKNSSKNILLNKNNNILYVHTPKMEQIEKWHNALTMVTTPYVLFSPDDDFISHKMILKAIDFLNTEESYICAQGNVTTFQYSKASSEVEYFISIDDLSVDGTYNSYLSVDDNSIEARIATYSEPYRHSIYAVHRTLSMQRVYKYLFQYKIKEQYLMEMLQAIMTVIFGKVAAFRDVYYIRERIPTSGGYRSSDILTLVKENHPELENAKLLLYNVFKLFYNDDNQINSYIDISINNFINFLTKPQGMKPFIINAIKDEKKEKYHLLQRRYQSDYNLKEIEKMIKEYNIYSGYLFSKDSQKIEQTLDFIKIYNSIEIVVEKVKQKRVVIYGAGSISKVIKKMIDVEFMVDSNQKLYNDSTHSVKYLVDNQDLYDVIVISVLGREEEIMYYLCEELKLKKPIVTIDF